MENALKMGVRPLGYAQNTTLILQFLLCCLFTRKLHRACLSMRTEDQLRAIKSLVKINQM